mmetsp:Transcript_26561/g.67017  ORF Transcript_26561/g.67017 Transcript_26561/m.67017 type:complete len:80 (+) Transcript_26561:3-242(+)
MAAFQHRSRVLLRLFGVIRSGWCYQDKDHAATPEQTFSIRRSKHKSGGGAHAGPTSDFLFQADHAEVDFASTSSGEDEE